MSNTSTSHLTNIWKGEISNESQFPDKLKLTGATSVFKKEDHNFLKNCRLVNILSMISKKFKRIIQKQIKSYID